MADVPRTPSEMATCPKRDDPPLRSMCRSIFRGRLSWLAKVGVVYGVIFLAAAIFTGVMFFRVETIRAQIAYATGFALSMAFMALTEMWFWSLVWRKSLITRMDHIEDRLTATEPEAEAPEHVEAPSEAA